MKPERPNVELWDRELDHWLADESSISVDTLREFIAWVKHLESEIAKPCPKCGKGLEKLGLV